MLQIQAQPHKPPLRNFNSPLLSRVENANQCSHQIQFSRLGKILLKQARNTCLSCSRYKHEARPPRNSTASRVCGTERAPILGMLSTVAKKWHWWVDLGRFLIFHFLLHDVSLGFEPLGFPVFFFLKKCTLHRKAFFCNQFRSCHRKKHVDKHKSEDLKEAKAEL